MWTFNCNKCHRTFYLKDCIEGSYVDCRKCGNLIQVPFSMWCGLKSIYNKINKWEIYCKCPRCKESYITDVQNIDSKARCRKCDYVFTIKKKISIFTILIKKIIKNISEA